MLISSIAFIYLIDAPCIHIILVVIAFHVSVPLGINLDLLNLWLLTTTPFILHEQVVSRA